MKLIPKVKQPVWQQKLQWIVKPDQYMDKAVKQAPDIFRADILGSGGYIFVNHPEAMRQMITRDRQKFSGSNKSSVILEPLVGKNSLLLLEGDRHKQRRKLLFPPFHGERMQYYGKLICDLTHNIMSQLKPNQSFIAREISQEISLRVILEAVYGLQNNEISLNLKREMTKLTHNLGSPLTSISLYFPILRKDLGAWSPWGNFLRQRTVIDKAIYQELAARKTQDLSYRQDILSLMMLAKDEEGESLNDTELRDELMGLMLVGHESTSTAIAWLLYWVYQDPTIKAKLTKEIASLGTNPDPMLIAKLPFLDAVCKETLRISPVFMLTFPNVVQEPTELMGYKLEIGQILSGCIYLIHHREDIYPEPNKFKPERFLSREFSAYEFFPFGGGKRRCIGEALATLEMKLVLATIVSNYKLELVNDKPEKSARRTLTIVPKTGVQMLLRE